MKELAEMTPEQLHQVIEDAKSRLTEVQPRTTLMLHRTRRLHDVSFAVVEASGDAALKAALASQSLLNEEDGKWDAEEADETTSFRAEVFPTDEEPENADYRVGEDGKLERI